MNTVQKNALNAIHLAATALVAATGALVASFTADAPEAATPNHTPEAATPAPAETPKRGPGRPPKAAATPPPAEPAAAPAKPAEPAAAAAAPVDLLDQCRKAAQEYAGVYGREGLRAILNKYTDKTMADVPADKLADLLKELS